MIERLTVPRSHHRDVLLIELQDDWQWPLDIRPDWFVAFIAADARGVPDPVIHALAREMLEYNCAYICAWGPGCERVHDAADTAYLDVTAARGESAIPFLMTTWHDDESLASALWFASVSAYPSDDDPCYRAEPTAFVALAAPPYLDEVRALLLDPERLDRESGRHDLIL